MPGELIAAGFWLAFAGVVAYGLSCDLRRWWRKRKEVARVTSRQIQQAIVRALRDGPMNHYDVADEIGQAPFRVRAELQTLKRERYVHERDGLTHEWALTDRGARVAYQQDQLEIEERVS
jgi:predicted transcriptional regulator